MSSFENARKINRAVVAGLARCRHSVAPIVALSVYIDDLHAAGWGPREFAEVELAIRRILSRVVQPTEQVTASQDAP